MMLKAADSSWTSLRRVMPAHPDPFLRRVWWRLAHESRYGDVFLKTEAAKMTEEERRMWGL